MSRILSSVILFLLASALTVSGQAKKPAEAEGILSAAIQKAESTNKNVLLIFHASWCGWCKRLDAALEDPTLRDLMEENYVITRLDVLESGEKTQTLENPGGKKIMNGLGGETSGLPFYAFLDAKGKKIADSNVMPKNQNIGYPGSLEEISAFESLLKKTAPKLTGGQLATIVAFLQKNMPR
ncbi:MAG: thioredoxin family protein [Ignavibacteriales bacterium]|nr:thioredoxin family protein [Ignavibacteriales bacterium]